MNHLPKISFCLCLLTVAGVHASVIYDLGVYTDNGDFADDPGLDMYVEVSQYGQDQVLFEIVNANLIDSSSIKAAYFGGGDYLDDDYSIVNSSGVEFFEHKKVAQLQGGMNSVLNTDYSLGTKNQAPTNGINAGEKLGVIFDIENGYDFDAINANIASGNIFVGVHLIALPDDSSEWALNAATPLPDPVPVPEPATLALFTFGAAVLAMSKRKPKPDLLQN